jgi:valyl-tRNA synthetase
MKGDATLWLPGADHAGFETQFVFEKNLAKEGKSRFDYDSREKLFQDIWDFVQKNRCHMENQLRRLGFSLDWSRKKFTLDEDIQKIIYSTFKKLYDAGLVYRGQRLVNYCTKCGTSFSDLEVKHEEVEGKLYYIKYKILSNTNKEENEKLGIRENPLEIRKNTSAQSTIQEDQQENLEYIVVATTRPETMFGDTAIAVHPGDTRYQDFVGKTAINPADDREIPIIADEYVTQEFGTGALKITPSHDENDFVVGQRHHLPQIQVIGFNGKLNENVPEEFRGLNVLADREKVIAYLQNKDAIEKIEPHKMVIAKCYRCSRALEPLPLPQWFVKVKLLVKPAIDAIEKGEIKIYPESKKDFATQWLNNFYDWNISRQIVWGMRIPAWKCNSCQEWTITAGETPNECSKCKSQDLIQDADTFDTWFSSSQWPFVTLMTTGVKDDFENFYPNSVMETGYDILPIWVCRMIFMGIFATEKIPFKNVYLHGLVRDGKGQKMSKSKGNVVNPLDMIDKYGADALRASLLFGVGQGADVPFSEDKVRAMRNFVTKLWNMGRFLLSVIAIPHQMVREKQSSQEQIATSPEFTPIQSGVPRNDNGKSNTNISVNLPFYTKDMPDMKDDDKTIIGELEELIKSVTQNFENYEFSAAFNDTYEFVWHRLADCYIEAIKERLKNGDMAAFAVLRHAFLSCLKLLHPFMPFVTEKIWSLMPRKHTDMLIVSRWPTITDERRL